MTTGIVVCQVTVGDGHASFVNTNCSTMVSTVVCQLTVRDGHTTA